MYKVQNRDQFKKCRHIKNCASQRSVLQHVLFITNPEKGMNMQVTELTDDTKLFTVMKIKTDRRVAEGFKVLSERTIK